MRHLLKSNNPSSYFKVIITDDESVNYHPLNHLHTTELGSEPNPKKCLPCYILLA
jgi:hypothetical protein